MSRSHRSRRHFRRFRNGLGCSPRPRKRPRRAGFRPGTYCHTDPPSNSCLPHRAHHTCRSARGRTRDQCNSLRTGRGLPSIRPDICPLRRERRPGTRNRKRRSFLSQPLCGRKCRRNGHCRPDKEARSCPECRTRRVHIGSRNFRNAQYPSLRSCSSRRRQDRSEHRGLRPLPRHWLGLDLRRSRWWCDYTQQERE